MPVIRCDVLICGAGLAGLSLLYRAMKSGTWVTEQIIVVDKSDKNINDKTWSFWKTGPSDFEEVISHQWGKLYFFSNDGIKIHLDNQNYTYNSIRSIDFYNHVLTYLRQFPNITFVKEDIVKLNSADNECTLVTAENTYQSTYLFNSVYTEPEKLADRQYFLQHFKGWRIKTDAVIPAISEAYLMDFRTGQEQGTTFFYTLPMAGNELFVEYTLFSKSILPAQEYDAKIKDYLANVLQINDYEIIEEEFGVIPMIDHPFKRFQGNIVHLGSAGGDTRASTGYTFVNTQKTIGKILNSYQLKGDPFFEAENISVKHQLYDTTLLHVLAERKYEGHQLFKDLFSNTAAYRIFAFLDAETSVLQDVYIMKSLRVMPFLRSFTAAVYRKLFRKQ